MHLTFWSLIDDARVRARRPGRLARVLEETLAALPPPEILGFDAWLTTYDGVLRREDLWAAAYLVRGEMNDEGFDAFRGWLIGRGEAAVLAAVRDPESLGELIGGADPRDPEMSAVARRAFARSSDADLPKPKWLVIPGEPWPEDRVVYGTVWDDTFFRTHYPKLHARFGSPPPAQP
jgi:hypothetical protein